MRKHRYALIVLGLCAAFALFFLIRGHTIAPLKIYGVYQPLYRSGNAIAAGNAYLRDVVDVFIPWKFYLSEYQPPSCNYLFSASGRSAQGIELPGGRCYPLSAVRPNLLQDSFFFWRKLAPFFLAYDLSFWLFLGFFFSAAYFCFLVSLRAEGFHAAVGAALLASSFPFAREWQLDGPAQGLPFLFLSLGCTSLFLRTIRGSQAWLAFALVFLACALIRTTLQAIVIYVAIYAGFVLSCFPTLLRNLRLTGTLAIGGLLALASALWYHQMSVEIFLQGAENYLPEAAGGMLPLLLRRALAILFSLLGFFTGDLLWGLDTVDFTKVLQPLGARDYYSYDGASIFLNPFAAFVVFSLITQSLRRRQLPPGGGVILILLAFDFIVSVGPGYKFLYFRFHQWWLSIALCGWVVWAFPKLQLDWRTFRSFVLWLAIPCVVLGAVAHLFRDRMLLQMGNKGVLGFEPGYWHSHLEDWLWRTLLLDGYAWLFLGAAAGGLWAWRTGARALLLGIIVVTGFGLNVLRVNRPQPTEIFWEYRREIESSVSGYHPDATALVPPGNHRLLVNQPPGRIYESLTIDD